MYVQIILTLLVEHMHVALWMILMQIRENNKMV